MISFQVPNISIHSLWFYCYFPFGSWTPCSRTLNTCKVFIFSNLAGDSYTSVALASICRDVMCTSDWGLFLSLPGNFVLGSAPWRKQPPPRVLTGSLQIGNDFQAASLEILRLFPTFSVGSSPVNLCVQIPAWEVRNFSSACTCAPVHTCWCLTATLKVLWNGWATPFSCSHFLWPLHSESVRDPVREWSGPGISEQKKLSTFHNWIQVAALWEEHTGVFSNKDLTFRVQG